MAPYVKNKSVRVVITDKLGGGYNFALNSNNGNGPVQDVDFDNDHHPGIIVYFNIDDRANSGLTFQPRPSDAVWAAAPGAPWPAPPACPVNPSHWEPFVPLSVEQNGTQLIVYYRNEHQHVHFPFALRFLDTNGAPVNYDPIGNGNNGMRS